jgi:hypothetical protein
MESLNQQKKIMKKKLLIIVPALFFGLSSLTYAVNGGNEKQQQAALIEVNQNINEAVKQQLNAFLNQIPVNAEKDFGFNDRSEFSKAVPASIYKMIGVDQNGKAFETGMYNVVVAVNNDYRAVLSVSFTNGKYEIETVGAAPLAKELYAVEQQNVLNANQERLIVNVYAKAATFVANNNVSANIENANLIPLASAKTGLQTETSRVLKATYTFSEAMQALELK